ncbi:UDP-glucose--hexose-1-phosphate uridylyltransferase [Paenibacillus contaminans]|uniref:Galactose-1-phosphate uridylyltransferase n=1 Tax=Paenibacillus contaminans TaxID=450362 RepID=A0A329LXT5_9BACL|nr:UDP-glucose--hexose-1-phosphate uridylyltransferase [Paenibacillus contaminans]RAV09487.1 galactose-1-phosphate uridylyltransferase [Paenibacillus contaminans]
MPLEVAEAQRNAARLIQYGVAHGMLDEADRYAATNALLDILGLEEPFEGELAEDTPDSAVGILEPLLDYAAKRGILPENTSTYRDLLDAKLMGVLLPRLSETIRAFWRTAEEGSIEQATDDFYRQSIRSNYIRMDRIAKNKYWLASTQYGDLEITINLSKPEKDPKEIAAERSLPQKHYPKCLLCPENVGYAGRLNHPARQNLRIIPLELAGSDWYLQYSPYVYYNEHSIVFSKHHTPMRIGRETFVRLLDFAGKFPHYFIGSNADLPIVGGSILNHDHFQGGRHRFPMEKAPVERSFAHPEFADIRAGIVKWPMSVVRLQGRDAGRLVELADRMLQGWRGYSDTDAEIIAESVQEGGVKQAHNTITPIVRRNGDGEFELDLVLRNNRTTEEHPFGLFHPHEPLHHIKKENIGLIEVMGLAVLPGRLMQELEQIKTLLSGPQDSNGEILEPLRQAEHPLHKHAAWVAELIQAHGTGLEAEGADTLLRDEVGRKFMQVLEDAGVYKRHEAGQAAFDRYMAHQGFHKLAE